MAHWAAFLIFNLLGNLAVQPVLSRSDLASDGGQLKYSYPSSSDVAVYASASGTCHRYLVVAYGKKKHGGFWRWYSELGRPVCPLLPPT